MTRFRRLEFEQQEQHEASLQQAQGLQKEQLDETHWLRQADQSRRHGQYEGALKFYSRALELNKSLVAGWLGQAQMLIALGEHPEAELWSRKALELFRNHPELLSARAQALCRIRDIKQAMALCDAALQQEGSSAYRWMVRGELMLARKELLECHCFDKATQLDPDWLVMLEIGDIYQYYGLLAKALIRLRQAVEKAPDQAHCWYRCGQCEMAMSLMRAAQLSLTRCLELSPKHQEARQCLRKLQESKWTVLGLLRRLLRRS